MGNIGATGVQRYTDEVKAMLKLADIWKDHKMVERLKRSIKRNSFYESSPYFDIHHW